MKRNSKVFSKCPKCGYEEVKTYECETCRKIFEHYPFQLSQDKDRQYPEDDYFEVYWDFCSLKCLNERVNKRLLTED